MQLPVLISLAVMCRLFDRSSQTVYRWNTSSGGREKMLPEPLLHVGGTPLWDEFTILAWAQERGLPVNESVLREIRREQSVAVKAAERRQLVDA